MRFNNKVAIVTGGGSGIGLATTRKLQREGASVIVAQRSLFDEAEFIQTDLSDDASCRALIKQTITRFGQLDILINNAGVMRESAIESLSMEDWQQHIAVNLTAPFILTRDALPHLRQSRGVIVNVGSIEGLGSNPGHAAYCASKGGIHALTRATAVDCGQFGIRCNAVAPGWIDTELNTAFVDSMPDPSGFTEKIKQIHPVGHTGKPQDVASLVCWLCSEEAAFVTGQIYTIDGGRTAKLSLPQ